MIFYVFDTCAVKFKYFDSPQPVNPKEPTSQEQYEIKRYERVQNSLAYITAQWVDKKAMLIIPNFVIAEMLNIFAFHHYRELKKSARVAKKDYERVKDIFIGQIRYSGKQSIQERIQSKKYFFNYELNRHHLLNLDKIFPIEHSTPPLKREVNMRYGDCELSAFDLLLISVAIELETLVGEGTVFIVTTEKRILDVCKKGKFPACYKIDAVTNPEKQLPKIEVDQKINIPIPSKSVSRK